MSENTVIYERSAPGGLDIFEQAKTLRIKTADDFTRSAELLAFINAEIERIEDQCSEPIGKAYALHKQLCNDRTNALKPWHESKLVISKARNDYNIERERIRAEERRKAEAKAAETARKEQERLLGMAAVAKTTKKQEELLERAENVYVAPVVLEPEKELTIRVSTGGTISSKEDFDIVVTDVVEICKAVAGGDLPVGIIEVKCAALKTFVKLQKLEQGDIKGFDIRPKFRDINRK